MNKKSTWEPNLDLIIKRIHEVAKDQNHFRRDDEKRSRAEWIVLLIKWITRDPENSFYSEVRSALIAATASMANYIRALDAREFRSPVRRKDYCEGCTCNDFDTARRPTVWCEDRNGCPVFVCATCASKKGIYKRIGV